MQVRINTLGDTKLPEYQTAGAVAFDISARERTVIDAKSLGMIPTGLIIETPPGYMLLLASRSSTPKKGLLKPHGVGIIDQDYCGPQDELKVQLYNFSDHEVTVEKGERIAQGIFVQIGRAQWQHGPIEKNTRGGFGSTG